MKPRLSGGSNPQPLNTTPPTQLNNNNDAVHHVAGEGGMPVQTNGDSSQGTGRPNGDGGMRARLKRMFDTKAVPHEPALRFEGDWQSKAVEKICRHWVESQTTHNVHAVSLVALSRMKALDYERKHRDSIAEHERLLHGNPSVQDYYEAQIEAFLNAIGISGDELTALMESFKLAGTGGLHRQHVTVAATVNGVIGGTAQFLSAQHPAAAAALHGARLLLQGVVAERILDSGWRRLRNAGREDVLPHGRADATPSAKQAPTMFEASHAVIWELKGVKKNLRKMETAMKVLEAASAAYKTSGTDADREKVENARKDLEIAFAKLCYQIEVKASYKAASESAKTEFFGNQRYLGTSYAGAGLSLGAGLFSILTPILGTAAAPATGGASIGAATLALLLYAGYQLSSGPSKDGEAKAKRAIVALSKSIDVLSGDKLVSREKRAAAYKAYIEDRKAARFKSGAAGTEAKEAAKAKLLAKLEEISQQDTIEDLMNAKQNWEAYRAYQQDVSAIENIPAQQDWQQEQIADQLEKLKQQFEADHQADFSTKVIADAWKHPMRIRMDTARRLLKGKVAQTIKQLLDLTRHPVLNPRFSRNNNEHAMKAVKTELRKNLRDMFNLELALHHMKPLIDKNFSDPAVMARAATAIGAIEDDDVRNTFCGDGQEQVEAANKAKKLTAGEAERYVYTNAGASSVGIGLNAAVGATDFGLTVAKASGAVHVGLYDPNPDGKPRIPEYNDYKFAAVSQAGAPLGAHLSAGNRAAFQKTQMPKFLGITTRAKDDRTEFTVNFNSDIVYLEEGNDEVDEKLDALVEQLVNADFVPDKIILPLMPHGPGTSAAAGVGDTNIAIDLQSTSAYHRAQYKNASRAEKLKVISAKAGIVGSHALMSLAGLPAQGIAQYNLKKTRAALNRAGKLDQKVRETLAAASMPGIVLEDYEAHSASEIQIDNEEITPSHHDEKDIEDFKNDPVFASIFQYYENGERLLFESDSSN